MSVYIPLRGPGADKPKAPAVNGWQSPGYRGVYGHGHYDYRGGDWFGLRCDGLVVVDCDDDAAADAWRSSDSACMHTWVRRTPRGYHFIYKWVPGAPDTQRIGIFPKTDIKAGPGSQIVFYAPGYRDITRRLDTRMFDPSWLPTSRLTEDIEEWDEMPDGRGNITMAALAGAMRKQGMSARAVARSLAAINRITMTKDPMTDSEIATITLSICRYTPNPDVGEIEVVE